MKLLRGILSDSLTICDELSQIIEEFSKRDLDVMLYRYGTDQKTLNDIGDVLGLTRERVRQICVRLKRNIHQRLAFLSTVKIQSSLRIAEDMGSGISFEGWIDTITTSGLQGVGIPTIRFQMFPPILLTSCLQYAK
jgi:hypothetical protein